MKHLRNGWKITSLQISKCRILSNTNLITVKSLPRTSLFYYSSILFWSQKSYPYHLSDIYFILLPLSLPSLYNAWFILQKKNPALCHTIYHPSKQAICTFNLKNRIGKCKFNQARVMPTGKPCRLIFVLDLIQLWCGKIYSSVFYKHIRKQGISS